VTTRVLVVAGARPNFMKVAPVLAALDGAGPGPGAGSGSAMPVFVHTGQHYDERLSEVFFEQLELRRPDHELDVGSGSHGAQTARVLERLEPVLQEERPDLVMVAGDVNSTLAAALCAAKLQIPVAHIEAGLRSRDRAMPEEINRIVTDQLSDLLFVTERSALGNLEQEGIARDRVHFVGNTMIDTLLRLLPVARGGTVVRDLGLEHRDYGVVTLHRPGNVDEESQLDGLVAALEQVSRRLPLVWPVHPRTRVRLEGKSGEMGARVSSDDACTLMLTEPLGYLEFLQLLEGARLVLTDSGGIQEETTYLGIPCLTVRDSTERPATIEMGTNRLVKSSREEILSAFEQAMLEQPGVVRRPPLWDGHTAERIVAVMQKLMS